MAKGKGSKGAAVAEKPKPAPVVEKKAEEKGSVGEYWVGTLPNSPYQNLVCSGISFPRFTQKVTHRDGSLRTQREQKVGAVIRLDSDKAKQVRQYIASHVVRVMGARSTVVGVDAKKPVGATDRPLGDFVYMLKTDEAVTGYGATWREKPPMSVTGK